tara:strand:- start:1124 stop:2323 length:1200 start_codon:yes stop_codon:yes gene_type:complete
MSLINQTNEEYYIGTKDFNLVAGGTTVSELNSTFEVKLENEITGVQDANYDILISTDNGNTFSLYTGVAVAYNTNANEGDLPFLTQKITLTPSVGQNKDKIIRIALKADLKWNNHGSYQYVKLNDVINNFLITYVGDGKLISNVKRTDVIFHAKRGLQEFSYDTLNSIKTLELTMPNNLSVIIPQDYVNYVRMSCVDKQGVLRPIYPVNNLTSDPTSVPLQDSTGAFIQDEFGENTEAAQALVRDRWENATDSNISGDLDEYMYGSNVYDWSWQKESFGQRYGLDPVTSQSNGWFNIDDRKNVISFSSNLANRLIILEYISDGLAYDLDTKLPKMAEEAMYLHIAYSILAGRSGIPEYLVQRFKRDKSAQLRNTKIRLSNMKLSEMIQNMRGKSKWIKN